MVEKESDKKRDVVFSYLEKEVLRAYSLIRGAVEPTTYYLINYLLVIKKVQDLRFKGSPEFLKDEIVNRFNISTNEIINDKLKKEFAEILQRVSDIALVEIVDLIDGLPERNFNRYAKELFDSLLSYVAKSHYGVASEGYQPKELTNLMTSLYAISPDAKVYNPFAGFASFATFLPKEVSYFGQEYDESIWAIGALRIIIHERESTFELELGNSIQNWNPQQQDFDLILASPPFGLRIQQTEKEMLETRQHTVEAFVIEKVLGCLSKKGKAVLAIPTGFLSGESKEERGLRKRIINEDLLELVITLPNQVLFNTSSQVNLLVLNRDKQNQGKVSFLNAELFFSKDASNQRIIDTEQILEVLERLGFQNSNADFFSKKTINRDNALLIIDEEVQRICHTVRTDAIVQNDFNINVNRYLIPAIEGVELGKLIEIIPQRKLSNGTLDKVVSAKNLKDDPLAFEIDAESEIDPIPSADINKTLLVTLWGKSLKPTIFKYKGTNLAISRELVACKIKEDIVDASYLIYEMYSTYFQKQLELYRTGNVLPRLNRTDLSKLQVKMPEAYFQGNHQQSLLEQSAIARGVKEALVRARAKETGLEAYINEINKKHNEELSIKKHTLAQHQNNIISSIDAMRKLMEKNQGIISSNELMRPNVTVGQDMDALAKSVDSISELIANLTNEETLDKKELVDVQVLLKDCMTAFKRPLFDYEYSLDEEAFRLDIDGERNSFLKPYIEVSPLDFQVVFNNIVENAVRHGFVNKHQTYLLQIHVTLNAETSLVEISFANNGSPFPRGIDQGRYTLKGEKGGVFGKSGYGGYLIQNKINHYGGKLEIVDDFNSDFPVKIIVGIPIKNIEDAL